MTKSRYLTTVIMAVLFLIFAFSIRFFYLVSADFLFLGTNRINTILIVLVYFLTYGTKLKIYSDSVTGCILSFVPIILISSMVASVYYDQPLLNGAMLQFFNYQYLLLFFPINELLKRKWLTLEDLFRLLSLFCCVLMFLSSVQYLFVANVKFMNCIITTRYSTTRLYIEYAYINFWLLWVIERLLYGRSKIINFLFILWGVFTDIAIIQSRAVMISLLAIIFVMMLFENRIGLKKLVIILIVALVIWYILKTTNIGQNILTIFNSGENDLSLDIRAQAREFYISRFYQSPLCGQGYPDTGLTNSHIKSGQSLGYFYVDNGIFGIMFYYGLLGLLWIASNFVIAIKKGIVIYKTKRIFFPLAYVIYMASLSISVQYDFFRPLAVYALFLAIICQLTRKETLNAKYI